MSLEAGAFFLNVTVLAFGSRGDVQPAVALSSRLASCGHKVRLVAPENFSSLALGRGIEFGALPMSMLQEMQASEASTLFSGDGNVAEIVLWTMKVASKWMDACAPILFAATEGAEIIVPTGLTNIFGETIAEGRLIPCVYAAWYPMGPAADFFGLPTERPPPRVPRTVNRWVYLALEQAIWMGLRPTLRRLRKMFGLDRASLTPPTRAARRRGAPFLFAYSGELFPRSREWPATIETTGWWFLDDGASWMPPAELAEFLSAGPPPVYVGFGSMSPKNKDVMLSVVSKAIERVGARAIIGAGWRALKTEKVSKEVFSIEEAPHDWLFPRMSAIVHHGGAGTTGAAVRAGLPSIVMPFAIDQFVWARLLHDKGVAPAAIPQRALSVDSLSDALATALNDGDMRRRAGALGERVRAEDGLARAVAVIEKHGRAGRKRS